MFDYKNLTEDEIVKIKDHLLKKIELVKMESEDSTSSEISDNIEGIFNVTNELLSLSTKEAIDVIEELLKDLLDKKDILSFDIFNNIVLELMSSGYIEKNGDEKEYTLLFFPVISIEVNKNLDKIHTIIKKSCVSSGMVQSEDEVIPMPQVLPHNFQTVLGIKDCYDYTSKFFLEEEGEFQNIPISKKGSNNISNALFYIPVFVKGYFHDLISHIAEENEKISDSMNEITSTIIQEANTEIFSPILWNEATPELLETIFINGTLYHRISSFCESLSNINKENTEVSIIRIIGNEQTALILLLDQKEYSILNAIIVTKFDNFIEDVLLPIMQHAILNNIPMSLPEKRISLNSAMDLFENTEVNVETRDELVKVFHDNEPEEDLETLYQLYSGATMRIQ